MKRYPKKRDFDTEEEYQQAWDDYFSWLDYVSEEYMNYWDDYRSFLEHVTEDINDYEKQQITQ